VVCSELVEVGNIWTDGLNGTLTCPEKFPYNYNYQKGFSFKIPKIDILVGPFGSGVGAWVESGSVHVTKLPFLNNADPGAPGKPGFQDWNLINWTLSPKKGQLWIVCGTDKDKPNLNPPAYEKIINDNAATWFDEMTKDKAKKEKAPEPSKEDPKPSSDEGKSTVKPEKSGDSKTFCENVKEKYKDASGVSAALDPSTICKGDADEAGCRKTQESVLSKALGCF
jgi:hypothetical protein